MSRKDSVSHSSISSGRNVGPRPSLVIGIDIGASTSAVSFSLSLPGTPSGKVDRVSRWPGQTPQKHSSIVPSVLLYDSDGQVVKYCGAEVYTRKAQDDLIAENLQVVKHFKLCVYPGSKPFRTEDGITIPIERIYADFMKYLYIQAKHYIENEYRGIFEPEWWSSVKFVITHPNSWGIPEQKHLRDAAVEADYVPEAEARARIHFVTEAEASVHSVMSPKLTVSETFMVCDAGGSTIDTAVYYVDKKNKLHEKKSDYIKEAGGVYVDYAAVDHLRRSLRLGSHELTDETIRTFTKKGVEEFEKDIKPIVALQGDDYRIQVTSFSTNVGKIVKDGYVTVDHDDMLALFRESSVNKILEHIEENLESNNQIKRILLVGGYSRCPLLRNELESRFSNITVDCPHNDVLTGPRPQNFKEVADGAVQWFLRKLVVSRVEHAWIGTSNWCQFSEKNPEHSGRHRERGHTGKQYVTGQWSTVVKKVSRGKEKRVRMTRKYGDDGPPRLDQFKLTLFATRAAFPSAWIFDEGGRMNDEFTKLCDIVADLGTFRTQFKLNWRLKVYREFEFNLVIRFGGTELEADIEQKNKRCLAQIVYDEDAAYHLMD